MLSAGVAVFGGSDGGGGLRGVGTRGQSVVARQPSGHQPFQWTGDPAGGQSHHPWGVPASMRNRGSRSKVMIALALQLILWWVVVSFIWAVSPIDISVAHNIQNGVDRFGNLKKP